MELQLVLFGRQIKVPDSVSFFKSQIPWSAIGRSLQLEAAERLCRWNAVEVNPLHDSTKAVKNVIRTILRHFCPWLLPLLQVFKDLGMVLEDDILVKKVLLEKIKVFLGNGFSIHDIAFATLGILHVKLEVLNLLDDGMRGIDGTVSHLSMVIVLCNLIGQSGIDAILRINHVGMVIQLNEVLQPLAINSLVILVIDKVGDFPDLAIEFTLDCIRDSVHTELVALAVITPVIGIDGEFAGNLDVEFAITNTEEYGALVSSVVLGNLLLTDKCCYFHLACL